MKTITFKLSQAVRGILGVQKLFSREKSKFIHLAGICVAISSLLDLPGFFSMTQIIQSNHFHLTQFNHHLPEMELRHLMLTKQARRMVHKRSQKITVQFLTHSIFFFCYSELVTSEAQTTIHLKLTKLKILTFQ